MIQQYGRMRGPSFFFFTRGHHVIGRATEFTIRKTMTDMAVFANMPM